MNRIQIAWIVGLFTLSFNAIAQTTNAVPLPDPPVPVNTAQYWDLAIAAVTPMLITGIRKLAPMIPKFVLPTITPVVGIILGLLLNWLAGANLTWVDMAKAGALAVFVREVVNQTITKNITPPVDAPVKPV